MRSPSQWPCVTGLLRRLGLMGNHGTGNEAGGLHFALGGVRAVGVVTAGALADFTPVARPAVQRFMVSVSSVASRSTPPIESIQHAAERSERPAFRQIQSHGLNQPAWGIRTAATATRSKWIF